MADSRSAAGPQRAPALCGTLNVRQVRTIGVRPGSVRPAVGGEHAGALVVRVSAQAVDGKATEAALAAVAAAFGVRRGDVSLVTGASGHTKVVEIADGDPRILAEPRNVRPGRCDRPRRDHCRPAARPPRCGGPTAAAARRRHLACALATVDGMTVVMIASTSQLVPVPPCTATASSRATRGR